MGMVDCGREVRYRESCCRLGMGDEEVKSGVVRRGGGPG